MPDLQCPKCSSTLVKSRRSWSSVGITLFIAVLLNVVPFGNIRTGHGDFGSAGLIAAAALLSVVFFALAIAFAIAAAVGKNKCRNCGYKWR